MYSKCLGLRKKRDEYERFLVKWCKKEERRGKEGNYEFNVRYGYERFLLPFDAVSLYCYLHCGAII